MSLSVTTNTVAMSSQRFLNNAESALNISLKRLSSGQRVNSAADDAAGLAIGDRFSAQIRGLNQAARNANDAISMLQTAEGGLSSATDHLQRMRELAVQAANGTNSASDLEALQKEMRQRIEAIDALGKNAEFNGMRLFDQGTESVVGDEAINAVIDGITKLGWLEQSEKRIFDFFGIKGDGANITLDISAEDGKGGVAAFVQNTGFDAQGRGLSLVLKLDIEDFSPPNLPNGGSAPYYNDRIIAHEMVHAVMARSTNYQDLYNNGLWFLEGAAESIHGADERLQSVLNNNFAGSISAMQTGVANRLTDFATTPNALFGSANGNEVNLSYATGYVAMRMLDRHLQDNGSSTQEFFAYYESNPTATLDDVFANTTSYASASAFLTAASAAVAADDTLFADTFGSGFSKIYNSDTGAIGAFDATGGTGPVLTAESVITNTSTRPESSPLENFNLIIPEDYLGQSVENFDSFEQKAFQVGANAFQTIDIGIGSLNTRALQLDDLDLTDSAAGAITKIDRALDYVSSARGNIGASLNRFESTISNLENTSINMSDARSRIMDTDFAQEMSNLTKNQILQQASSAMLAQAKNLPGVVISLLNL